MHVCRGAVPMLCLCTGLCRVVGVWWCCARDPFVHGGGLRVILQQRVAWRDCGPVSSIWYAPLRGLRVRLLASSQVHYCTTL